VKDFAPLGGLADLQHLLVVRKDLPAASVPELLAFAKNAGRELTCASTGPGSASHLTMELFRAKTGSTSSMFPIAAPRRCCRTYWAAVST
jgi:tripartite-type tricarboxylate transporter receptor subunit TctC